MSDLVIHECPACGVRHGFPAVLEREAKDNRGPGGRTIYCPNGHAWHFTGKSDAEKLREQLAREQEQAKRTRESLERSLQFARGEARQAEAARRAWKASATKAKKRSAEKGDDA